MKALIFNSGIGKRMGELTKQSPKSMVKLLNGETVFERQIRILSECGIKDFVITTGPFEEQLKDVCKQECYSNLNFVFVHNDIYDKTNYIYSFYLARKFLDDDFITLHGDLVFTKKLIKELLLNKDESMGLFNKNIPLPEKDFKCRVINNKITEVGINIFDKDCFTFQPLYKLSKRDLDIWLDSIIDFIENQKICTVYAENAFNVVSNKMNIIPFSYEGYFINEIDNIDDYKNVSKEIELFDYRDQTIINSLDLLVNYLNQYNISKPFVIIDSFLKNSFAYSLINNVSNPVYFDDFKPNPVYEDVLKSKEAFCNNKCDGIISIGGGSAIDTAKALKMFLPLEGSKNYLLQETKYINIKHIAIPTTAGTGSESTRYAVIYYDGKKQSLCNDMLIPDVAVLDHRFLKTLPLKQKKATIFDALCQGIESYWSDNSTEESKEYSLKAIKIILNNIDSYFENDEKVMNDIMMASNYAGKAINITQTTAAHAMSYKLTSLFGIPHGQAVAICLPFVWKYLTLNYENTIDIRGKAYLYSILDNLCKVFGTKEPYKLFNDFLVKYDMKVNLDISDDEYSLLISSVNPIRLKNFPIVLKENDISSIYHCVFERKKDMN